MVRREAALTRALREYGEVRVTSYVPHAGIFIDAIGREWAWSVFGKMVTFTRDGWRTRSVAINKVSKYMFEWLLEDDAARDSLDFTISMKEVIDLFGVEGAHQAFLKYRGAA